MEEHVHGPECEEAARELRKTRAAALVSVYPKHKRDALLKAAQASIVATREAFGGLTDEQVGDVMEVIGDLLHALMVLPVYELSDSLTDSSTAYTIASAHLLAGFELPESAEDMVLPEKLAEALKGDAPASVVKVSDDDFRPGNYL